MQRSVNDLYGLMLFLGVEPYWVKFWWDRMLFYPFDHGDREPMLGVLKELMWRNAKADVACQLGIPCIKEVTDWLNFSPVEDWYYRRLLEQCRREVTP
jgi:E3 ubiquitin-protein ligase SHPRH